MNIWKIFFVNIMLMGYGIFVLGLIFTPQGHLYEIYQNYKKIQWIKRQFYSLEKKNQYIAYLINQYKSNDPDIKNLLFFLKFNKISKGYKKV